MGFFRRNAGKKSIQHPTKEVASTNHKPQVTDRPRRGGHQKRQSVTRREYRQDRGDGGSFSASLGEALAPHDQFDLYIPLRSGPAKAGRGMAPCHESSTSSRVRSRAVDPFDETSTASSVTLATFDFSGTGKARSSYSIQGARMEGNGAKHPSHSSPRGGFESSGDPRTSHRPETFTSSGMVDEAGLTTTIPGGKQAQQDFSNMVEPIASFQQSCCGPEGDEMQTKAEKVPERNNNIGPQGTRPIVKPSRMMSSPRSFKSFTQQTDAIEVAGSRTQDLDPQLGWGVTENQATPVEALPVDNEMPSKTSSISFFSNCCGPQEGALDTMVLSEERSTQTHGSQSQLQSFHREPSLLNKAEAAFVEEGDNDFRVHNQCHRNGQNAKCNLDTIPPNIDEGDTAVAHIASSDFDDVRDDDDYDREDYYIYLNNPNNQTGGSNDRGWKTRLPKVRSIPKIRPRSFRISKSGRGRASLATDEEPLPRRRSRSRGRKSSGMKIQPTDLLY